MSYYGTERWFADIDDAVRSLRVVGEETSPGVRFVRVEADTGSNYTVVASELDKFGSLFVGAPMLVSVVQPWQTCYPVQREGLLHWMYVEEKFLRPGIDARRVNGGDLAAITLALGHLLGRPTELPVREPVAADG